MNNINWPEPSKFFKGYKYASMLSLPAVPASPSNLKKARPSSHPRLPPRPRRRPPIPTYTSGGLLSSSRLLACLSALVSRIHRISGPRFTQRVFSIKPTVNPKKTNSSKLPSAFAPLGNKPMLECRFNKALKPVFRPLVRKLCPLARWGTWGEG